MKRIAVVVASRANYARIRSVLAALRENEQVELQLSASASALLHPYGNAVEVMIAEGFEPAARVQCLVEGETPAPPAAAARRDRRRRPGAR